MKGIIKIVAAKAFLLFSMIIGLCLASCEDLTDGNNAFKKKAHTTLLVYMVGQNDLSSYMVENINNMIIGYGKTDTTANILIYQDINSTPTLYYLNKASGSAISKQTVRSYPDQLSVDPEVMKSVINNIFEMYPAEKYGIIFSSHADGSLFQPDIVQKRSFGDEKDSNGQVYGMNIQDINNALSGSPYLNFILFDACLMANVETAYELRNRAHYLLATPNSVPGEGFPYHKIMPDLLQMDEKGLENVAEQYYDYFHSNSARWDDFVAISLTDLSKMDSLAEAVDSLCRVPAVQERIEALDNAGLQMYERTKELYDFGQWVDSVGCGHPQVAVVKEKLEEAVIYKEHSEYTMTDDWGNLLLPITDARFSGLNTFLPGKVNTTYDLLQHWYFTTLEWYRDAGLWRCPRYNEYEMLIQ